MYREIKHKLTRLYGLLAGAERQATVAALPNYLRVDENGVIFPEDAQAEQQAKALGIVLKEYIVSSEWDPSMIGIDP